jgi:hypothetical protein
MVRAYWRIDIYDPATNTLVKMGKQKFKTDYEAMLEARSMTHIPHNLEVKIIKREYYE